MFARRFWDRLFGLQGYGWLKVVGCSFFMMFVGIFFGLSMIGRTDGLEGAAAWGALTASVLICTVLGAILGVILVARDVVKLQLEEGNPVNFLLRLVLASGIVSLLIWVVGAFGGAIVLTMLLIYLDTSSFSGGGNVAANTPVGGGNTAPVTPDPAISDFDSPEPRFDRLRPSPVIPPVLPVGATPSSNDEVEQTPAIDDPVANTSEPPSAEFIEPLIIGSDVPAKEAYARFVERYGAEHVARVVVRLPSESPAAEARLRGELARQIAFGQPPSIYVSAQKTTVAGIVAPVESLVTLTDDFQFGEVTEVRESERIVTVTFAENTASSLSGRPPVPEPKPETSDEDSAVGGDPLAQLVEQFDGGDLRAQREAASAIAALNTPQAAQALAERLRGNDRLAASQALESMGEVAHAAVLVQAESDDFATSAAAFRILRETGTKKLLPKLQRLARHRDQRIASQAKLTISAIGRQR